MASPDERRMIDRYIEREQRIVEGTNQGKFMHELEDPEFCVDSPGPRKQHDWVANPDRTELAQNICSWCGVVED